MASHYRDSRVLVTGGLGFIGSNLALRLASLGAQVTVVDSSVPGCGANPQNLGGASIFVIPQDIANAPAFASELRAAHVIFNLAGEISHIQSMRQPGRDLDLNAAAHLHFLNECARQNPGVRVVYASTRQIYGAPKYLPVDENHPIQPLDFNGVHKFAATAYHQVLTSAGKLDAVALCLTNIYGPRMALNQPSQGFLGGFLRKALLRQPIEVFGEGRQLRDPLYVDDAVEALLLAGAVRNPRSRVWNVGGSEALSVSALAQIAAAAAGAPEPIFKPFPRELQGIEIGSYYSDTARIRADLGWRPQTAFARGVRLSLQFYRRELTHYLNEADYQPAVRPASEHPACEHPACEHPACEQWIGAQPQPVAV